MSNSLCFLTKSLVGFLLEMTTKFIKALILPSFENDLMTKNFNAFALDTKLSLLDLFIFFNSFSNSNWLLYLRLECNLIRL